MKIVGATVLCGLCASEGESKFKIPILYLL